MTAAPDTVPASDISVTEPVALWRRAPSAWRRAPSALRDVLLIIALGALFYALEARSELWSELFHHFHDEHDRLADALVFAGLPVMVGLLFFSLRRWMELGREVGRREAAETAARTLAVHDALTGLPNRRRLTEELGAMLARARRTGGSVVALMVDLDRFKPVNDAYGHAAGDQLLQEVASRLRGFGEEVGMVARLGGDEFIVVALLENQGPPASDVAARLATRLLSSLSRRINVGETGTAVQVQVGASVGVALAPGGDCEVPELLRRADLAMYRAKSDGRSCFRFFEAHMDAQIRDRALLEADLRQAIAQDVIEPYFQPLVSLDPSGGASCLIGFEMLARWPHPTRGMVPPASFIPIAEDTGEIVPLTERLLRRACRAAQGWPEHLTLAVNISAVQLRDRTLPAMLRAVLAETGLPAHRLEVELTESTLLEDFDLAREVLDELRSQGVRLALDDFGTGYSSLRHLQALKFDKLKVDAGFVRSMASNAESGKIVAAVVGLGQSLGLPTVAEGVEDSATAEVLARMGCDIGQGWLYGRPMPVDAAAVFAAAADDGADRCGRKASAA